MRDSVYQWAMHGEIEKREILLSSVALFVFEEFETCSKHIAMMMMMVVMIYMNDDYACHRRP